MNIVIPKNFVGTANYAARCDYIFNQGFKDFEYQNNKLSDITDNSTVYCWSGFLNHLFNYLKQTNIKNITLISGCEDLPANPNGTVIGMPVAANHGIIPCPQNISRWFAQNAEIFSNFMIPAPIGLNIFPYKVDTIKEYLTFNTRDKLLYINIGINSNPLQRSAIKDIITKQCPNNKIQPSKTSREYCELLQEHIFCLCPPGNGKDTHRVWESLAFGCIPVVEKSSMNDYYASLFPILVVDRWSDITEEFLYKKYEELKLKQWRYDLLDVDTWFDYYNIKKSNKHLGYAEIWSKLTVTLSPDYNKNIINL